MIRVETRTLPNGRRILSLQTGGLPVGDFDQVSPPGVAPRLYRTRNGWRVFYTDRGRGWHGRLMHDLLLAGCDPRYILHASINEFSARVTPKADVPEPWCVARLVHQHGEIHPDWREFVDKHDRWVRAAGEGELC